MKYKYTVKLVDDYDPNSIILDLPNEVNLFAAFLFDAIPGQEEADSCMRLIERVTNNELQRGEFFGDIYKVTITKGMSYVEDIVDQEEYHSEMRTTDFEELIQTWMSEKRLLDQ